MKARNKMNIIGRRHYLPYYLISLIIISFVITLIIINENSTDEMKHRDNKLQPENLKIAKANHSDDVIVTNMASVKKMQTKRKLKMNYAKSLYNSNSYRIIVHSHHFVFKSNIKEICNNHPDMFILCVVHSAPKNIAKRQVIRQTWGNKKLYSRTRMLVLFVMGTTGDVKLNSLLNDEINRHNDIIISNFTDSYRNLTYKLLSWLKWTSDYCIPPSYVLKTDDDVFVNVFELLNMLHDEKSNRNQILCSLKINHHVFRDKTKWRVSRREYPDDRYPPHCPGYAIILPRSAVPKLYNASHYLPFYWIDDVYFTGHLRIKAALNISNISERFTDIRNGKFLVYGNKIFAHSLANDRRIYVYWKALALKYNIS